MSLTREQREQLTERLERIDHFIDPAVDFVELGNNGLAFWEAYFWGRVACHFHMRIGERGRQGTCNLCAEFQVFRGMPEVEFDAFNGTFFKVEFAGEYKYGGYHPVFISVREDAEDGQRVPLRLASSVRLEALDDCPMRGEHVFEGIGLRKLFRDDTPVGGFDFYRKSGSPRPTAHEFPSLGFQERELPNEMVEDTSQVMHDIAHEQAQSDSWQFGGSDYLKDILSRLRIELTAESYEVRVVHEESGADYFIEDIAMFPRPHKLRPASVQRVRHVVPSKS